jgi:hypothetical protein
VARRISIGIQAESPEAIKAIINLPRYSITKADTDPSDVTIHPDAILQLKYFIGCIPCLYKNENPFHNFEHATHMTLLVFKLLKRIVASTMEQQDDNERELHDHMYGIRPLIP